MNWFHHSHVIQNYSCGFRRDNDATVIFLSLYNERVLVFLLYSRHSHYTAYFHIIFHMEHHFVVSFLLKCKSRIKAVGSRRLRQWKTTVDSNHGLFFFSLWSIVALQCYVNWIEFPVTHSRFSLLICFIHSSTYISVWISQFTPLPTLTPFTHLVSICFSLCLCLYFCSANKIFYTIFLVSTYICEYVFVFLYLTYCILCDTL